MTRQTWLLHLFINSLILFTFATIQLFFKMDLGFWLPLFLWIGLTIGESFLFKNVLNSSLNLEKLLFQVFCIFGSLGILSSLNYALNVKELPKISIQFTELEVDASQISSAQWFLDPDFLVYWADTPKKPFQEISEKKALDPISLELPPFPSLTFLSLPIAPYPQFSQLPKISKKMLFEQFILNDEEREILEQEKEEEEERKEKEAEDALEKEMEEEIEKEEKDEKEDEKEDEEKIAAEKSELKRLRALRKLGARPYDTLILKNGSQLEGKVLNQLNGDVLLEVKVGQGKNSRFKASREEIEKLVPALPLAELYKQKAQETTFIDAQIRLAKELVGHSQTFQDKDCMELAQEIYQKILEDRSNEDIFIALDDLLTQQGDLEKRLRLFQFAKEKNASFGELLCREGEVLKIFKLNSLAEAKWIEAKKQAKDSQRPSSLLIQHYLEAHKLKKAEQELKELGETANSYPYLYASFLYYSGKFKEAEKALTEMLPEQQQGTPEINFLLGNCLYYQNKFREAISYYQSSLNVPHALENMAACYLRLKRIDKAKELYSTFIQENPANPAQGYLGLAIAELGIGETEKADKLLENAIKTDPTNILASYYNSLLLYFRGEVEQAEEQLKSILNHKFNFKEPCLLLSQIMYENGQLELASLYLEEYLTAHTQDYDRFALLAYLHLINEQFDLAFDHFDEILSFSPSHLYTLKGLGYLENLRQNQKEALNRFEEILAIHPEDSYAKQNQKLIQNNLNYVRWDDNFSRKDSLEVARQWNEEEEYGIQIQVSKQQVLFTGTQQEGNKYSVLDRTTEAEKFISIKTDIFPKSGQIQAGLIIRPGKEFRGYRKTFYFGKDKRNQIVYSKYDRGKQTFQWVSVGTWPKDEQFHQLQIQRQNFKQGTFKLLLDGKVLVEDVAIPEFKAGKLRAGIFGGASKDIEWSLFADNIRLIEKKDTKF